MSVAGVAAAQAPASAAGAYGSSTSCTVGGSKVTIAPHFGVSGTKRNVDGYSFYTSPTRKITYVYEQVYGITTAQTYGTQTSPNATSAVRADLGRYYPWSASGTVLVNFKIGDGAGNYCWTGPVQV